MIEMENITKAFELNGKSIPILKGISLFIGKGEFVSIMGPSGSGKSTLSSLLGCLATPSSGSYKLGKREVAQLRPSNLARLRNRSIGFVFQDFNLLDGLSAWENVALPLFYGGVAAKERRQRAQESLVKVGLENRIGYFPNQLSGGQKQRVAIARALVNEPAFLFADELCGALDKKTGHEIMGLLQKLNLQGQTIVMVTHSSSDANYSKRILHLVDGLVVKDELVEKPTIGFTVGDSEVEKENDHISRLWRVSSFCPVHTEENFTLLKELYQKTTHPEALVQTARALLKWDTDEARSMVRDLFNHASWIVRAEVIRNTEGRTKEFAVPLCLKGIQDTNAWVRFLSLSSLQRLWPPPHSISEGEQSAIAKLLEDEDERVRASAVVLVGRMRNGNFEEQLLLATQDKDGRVRANAIEALAPLSDNAVARIKECLDDKNNRARVNAALLLYQREPKMVFESLVSLMASDNHLLRSSAAWALGQLPTDEGGALLIQALKSETEEVVVNQVVRSLGNLSKKQLPLSTVIQAVLERSP